MRKASGGETLTASSLLTVHRPFLYKKQLVYPKLARILPSPACPATDRQTGKNDD